MKLMALISVFAAFCPFPSQALAAIEQDLNQACINHRKYVQKAEPSPKDEAMCKCIAGKIDSDSTVTDEFKRTMVEKWNEMMDVPKDSKDKDYWRRGRVYMEAVNACAREQGLLPRVRSSQPDFTPLALRVTFATALNSVHMPLNDLKRIPIDAKGVFVSIKLQVTPNRTYRFDGQLFDSTGKQVLNYKFSQSPGKTPWYTWFHRPFNPAKDRPGIWKFRLLVDGVTVVEQTFDVVGQ